MLSRYVKRVFERATGFEIERFGRTIALIDPARSADAWFSYTRTLESLFSTLRISTVLDIGANRGQFARAIRPLFSGPIHSFEPVSTTFAELSAACAGDPLWKAHRMALGSHAGEQPIHVSASSDFSSMLQATPYSEMRFGTAARQTSVEVVPVRRLEDVLPALCPALAEERIFLKMDTQGYDLNVFRGLGPLGGHIVALQSEVSLIPLYQDMPHWTESLAEYERGGFGIVGMYPVSRDDGRVIEFDCLLSRPSAYLGR